MNIKVGTLYKLKRQMIWSNDGMYGTILEKDSLFLVIKVENIHHLLYQVTALVEEKRLYTPFDLDLCTYDYWMEEA